MKTYQLTRHFALNEFTRSATAIANGIDNNLDLAKADDRMVAENLQYLCQTVLEPLREHFGMPVVVSSGYRCKELNKLVSGVRNSQHLPRRQPEQANLHDPETVTMPILHRASSVPSPCLHRSVDNRWTIGGQSVEA